MSAASVLGERATFTSGVASSAQKSGMLHRVVLIQLPLAATEALSHATYASLSGESGASARSWRFQTESGA